MTVPVVSARPERLRHIERTAAAMAEGLAVRGAALRDAAVTYRRYTEPGYEADCAAAFGPLRAFAAAVQALGEWVGRVGDAFDGLPVGLRGVHLGPLPQLQASLPPELRFAGEVDAGAGRSDGVAATEVGAAIAVVAGTAAVAGAGRRGTSGRPPRTPPPRAASPVAGALNGAQVVMAGLREAEQRWDAEQDRGLADRAYRAAFDGGMQAAGVWAGARAGEWIGTTVCSSTIVMASGCGLFGSRIGGDMGSRAAEWVSDRALGDEPEPWERDPFDVADEVADVDADFAERVEPALEDARAGAEAHARRHAELVLDHPDQWDQDGDGVPGG